MCQFSLIIGQFFFNRRASFQYLNFALFVFSTDPVIRSNSGLREYGSGRFLFWQNISIQSVQISTRRSLEMKYSKSFSDIETSEKFYFPEADWEFVRGILKFVIYGGRIENDFDAKVLDSYLNILFSNEKINGTAGQTLVKGIEIPATTNVKVGSPSQ